VLAVSESAGTVRDADPPPRGAGGGGGGGGVGDRGCSHTLFSKGTNNVETQKRRPKNETIDPQHDTYERNTS